MAAMNSFAKAVCAVAVVAFLFLFLSLFSKAEGCTRCRRNPCVFQSRVVHSPVVRQVVQKQVYVPTQSIVFNNTYPAAQPGLSGFVAPSYQSLAASYQPTVSQFIELAKQGHETTQTLAQIAAGQAHVESGYAALQERTKQIMAIANSIGSQPVQQNSVPGHPTEPATGPECADATCVPAKKVNPEVSSPENNTGMLTMKCAKCHDKASPPNDFFFDGKSPISDETSAAVLRVLVYGKTDSGETMPPKGSLTDAEISQSIIELAGLTKVE